MAPSIDQDIQRKLYDLLSIAAPQDHESFRQFFTCGVVGANVLVFLGWYHADRQASQKKHRLGSSQRGQSKWNLPPQLNKYLDKLPPGEKMEKIMGDNFALTEHNVRRGRWWTVLTSAFSHRQVVHLATNMVSFVTCADLALGPSVGIDPLSMVILALGSALAGSGAQLLEWHWQREQRKKGRDSGSSVALQQVGLGASGMINGMNVALTLLRPMLPVNVMMLPRPVPMWLATVAFAAWDYFNLDNAASSGVGHAAHLGGAAFGALFYLVRLRSLDRMRVSGGWPWY
ncbi:hypothetical protein F4809DRAFT_593147 [Biscogniauxia mediterranea]|nr:hypothetical protein F4809DRAFT_593147 [Biscogniauxia mediterranea]